MSEEGIRLRFGYTLMGLIRAYRLYASKKPRRFIEKLIGIGLIGFGVLFLRGYYNPVSQRFEIGSGGEFFTMLIVVVGLGIIVGFDLASILGIWVGFRSRAKDTPPKEYDFVFDDNGAEYKLVEANPEKQIQLRMGWDAFSGILEDHFTILLVTRGDEYWAIPKHVFSTLGDLARFRELLQSKFKKFNGRGYTGK